MEINREFREFIFCEVLLFSAFFFILSFLHYMEESGKLEGSRCDGEKGMCVS
jgi:hypothetical protein